MAESVKHRIGATAAHITLYFIAKYLGFPNVFLFSIFLTSFAPLWLSIVKFFIAVIKNSPKIVIPSSIACIIAVLYAIYKYGFCLGTLFLIASAVLLTEATYLFYIFTFNLLSKEGINSYRKKALFAYMSSVFLGTLILVVTKIIYTYLFL